MRQEAWLSTAPEMPNQKKSGKMETVARRESMERTGREIELPPCDASYLIGYLYEVGPLLSGGMGPAVLSQTEIQAWQLNRGIELTSWEAQVLRRLSAEYLSESNRAKSPACPAPFSAMTVEEKRAAIPNQIKNILRG